MGHAGAARYNSRMAVRLIALDLDGTLLDSRACVPQRNIDALSEAVARGIEIVLVTGRRFDFAMSVVAAIPLDFTLIVCNGALIRSRDGRTHARRLLSRATAREVLAATRDFRGCAAVIFDRPGAGQVICENIDFADPIRAKYYERNREFIAEVSPLENCLADASGGPGFAPDNHADNHDGSHDAGSNDPIQVMFTGGVEPMRAVVRLLGPLAPALGFEVTFTEYPARDFALVDVLAPGCTKGRALDDWARLRGISPAEIMAIGDNWNDREMLEMAGVPVWMDNAAPELKSLGWRVTLSNDECGVAAAIREFAFGEAREATGLQAGATEAARK
jgi:hydroxymethylpyrimidine pyrophosphatase-like HAD family hydrolase